MLSLLSFSSCGLLVATPLALSTSDPLSRTDTMARGGEVVCAAVAPSDAARAAFAPVGHGSNGAAGAKAAVAIDFDDGSAPCNFVETAPLRAEYQSDGVLFFGRKVAYGGAVLDECSNFSVTGYSAPNFLAFNADVQYTSGGFASGPEFVRFSSPKTTVQLGFASPQSGSFVMLAYNASGAVVASTTRALASTMQPASVHGNGIVGVVFYSTTPWLVVDDLAAN